MTDLSTGYIENCLINKFTVDEFLDALEKEEPNIKENRIYNSVRTKAMCFAHKSIGSLIDRDANILTRTLAVYALESAHWFDIIDRFIDPEVLKQRGYKIGEM